MPTSQSNVVVVHQPVDGVQFASNVELLDRVVEVLDGWMGNISLAIEDLLGLLFLVWLVYIVDGQDGQMSVIAEISESKSGSWLNA